MNVQHEIEYLEEKAQTIKIELRRTLSERDELYERILLTHSEHTQLVSALTKIHSLHCTLTIVLTKLHFLKGCESIQPFNLYE